MKMNLGLRCGQMMAERTNLNGQRQLFNLSDSLLQSLNKCIMLMNFTWTGNQIFRSVVVPDAIKVMDDPPVRKRFVMCLFPYQSMFKYFPTSRKSNISIFGPVFAALPQRMFLSTCTIPNCMFPATLCCVSNEFTADWARFSLSMGISIIVSTLYTCPRTISLPAITTSECFITKNTLIFILHIRSISQRLTIYKYLVGIDEFDQLDKLERAKR